LARCEKDSPFHTRSHSCRYFFIVYRQEPRKLSVMVSLDQFLDLFMDALAVEHPLSRYKIRVSTFRNLVLGKEVSENRVPVDENVTDSI
jgi:hypothetical protein